MRNSTYKVLILYFSNTGNTEKLAKEIEKGVNKIKDVECKLRHTSDVTQDDFTSCDAIIAGSPVYFGTMAAELKEVFDRYVVVRKKMGGKIGAAFATSGDETGGKETTIISIIQAFLIYGMIIVGDPLEATGHYGVACKGSPDKETSKYAQILGKRVANLVKKLKE